MKNITRSILPILILLLTLTACASPAVINTDKPVIVCTLFPQYDFAKTIAGEYAEVIMLLPAGVESHMFEPTPKDMITLNSASMFIYTGAEMEPWADRILKSLDNENLLVVDGSQGRADLEMEHEDHEEGDEHEHETDPHFWLDFSKAADFATDIGQAIAQMDSTHKDIYEKNTEALKQELLSLDSEFTTAVKNASQKTIVFGGRFAWSYFIHRYGLEYKSAYDGCSTQTEPSVKTMLDIENFIKNNGIKAVFHEELAKTDVADAIARDTGAKSLLLHTGHNVSKDDREAGVSFVEIMKNNLANLKQAID